MSPLVSLIVRSFLLGMMAGVVGYWIGYRSGYRLRSVREFAKCRRLLGQAAKMESEAIERSIHWSRVHDEAVLEAKKLRLKNLELTTELTRLRCTHHNGN